MGQKHSSKQDGQSESSKVEEAVDATDNISIQKNIKREEENDYEKKLSEGNLIKVQDDSGSGFITIEVYHVKKKPVMFGWEHGGKEVSLLGSFNNWKKVPMVLSDGKFTAIIELPSGTHEFKYFVDGNWRHNPSQNTVDDTFDGRNNVITVSESDFDPTEANETSGKKENSASFDGGYITQ